MGWGGGRVLRKWALLRSQGGPRAGAVRGPDKRTPSNRERLASRSLMGRNPSLHPPPLHLPPPVKGRGRPSAEKTVEISPRPRWGREEGGGCGGCGGAYVLLSSLSWPRISRARGFPCGLSSAHSSLHRSSSVLASGSGREEGGAGMRHCGGGTMSRAHEGSP